jgi:hypothetical protein
MGTPFTVLSGCQGKKAALPPGAWIITVPAMGFIFGWGFDKEFQDKE